jgi:hypothetical protein
MTRFNPFTASAPFVGMPRQATQPPAQATQPAEAGIDLSLVYLLAQSAFNPSTTADYCACDAARAALSAALPSELFASLERGDRRTPEMDRAVRVALVTA